MLPFLFLYMYYNILYYYISTLCVSIIYICKCFYVNDFAMWKMIHKYIIKNNDKIIKIWYPSSLSIIISHNTTISLIITTINHPQLL